MELKKNCIVCNSEFIITKYQTTKKYCSRKCHCDNNRIITGNKPGRPRKNEKV